MKLTTGREMSIRAPSLVHGAALLAAAHVNLNTLPGLVVLETDSRFNVDGIYSFCRGDFGIERDRSTKALVAEPSKAFDGLVNCAKTDNRTSVF